MTRRDSYLFIFFLMLWIILSWSVSVRDLAGGAVFAAAAVFVMRPMGSARGGKNKEPMYRRVIEVIIFALCVFGDLCAASVRIIARCFKRAPSDFLRRTITVSLNDDAALTLISLAMTLTTDAAVIDTSRASHQIDCMIVNDPNGIARTERVIRRYEKMLSRVFD